MSQSRSCAVYRLFDARDQLLYVGKSADVDRRVQEHRKSKDWGYAISRFDSVEFSDDMAASREERRVILEEGPVHNRQVPSALPRETSTVHVHFKIPRQLYQDFALLASSESRTVRQQALCLMAEYVKAAEQGEAVGS